MKLTEYETVMECIAIALHLHLSDEPLTTQDVVNKFNSDNTCSVEEGVDLIGIATESVGYVHIMGKEEIESWIASGSLG